MVKHSELDEAGQKALAERYNAVFDDWATYSRTLGVEGLKHLLTMNAAGVAAIVGLAGAFKVASSWLGYGLLCFFGGVIAAGIAWWLAYWRTEKLLQELQTGYLEIITNQRDLVPRSSGHGIWATDTVAAAAAFLLFIVGAVLGAVGFYSVGIGVACGR